MKAGYRRLIALPVVAVAVALGYLLLGGLRGAVVGFLIALPFALYLIAGGLKGFALGLLLDLYALSYYFGNILTVLLAVMVTLVVLFVCSTVTTGPQPTSPIQSFLNLISLAAGTQKRSLKIQGGKITAPLPEAGPLFGPFPANIGDGNVAVLEKGGQLARIIGPGQLEAKPGEFVRTVVDLTPQRARINVEEAFTRDRIPLQIELEVQYRIQVDPQELRQTGKHAFQEETIRKATLMTQDWKQDTKTSAASVTRDVISIHYLDDLYDPRQGVATYGHASPRIYLQREIRNRLNALVSDWGVRIESVSIGRIDVPDEVRTTMVNRWQADWQKQVAISVGEGKAEIYRVMEKARAQAQMQMIIAITQAFQQTTAAGVPVSADLITMRFIEALEKMSSDPATKIVL